MLVDIFQNTYEVLNFVIMLSFFPLKTSEINLYVILFTY